MGGAPREWLFETGRSGGSIDSDSALPTFLRSVCWAYSYREEVGINARFELGGKPVATDAVSWSGGRMAFIVDTYLAPVAAPHALVTSVRCVLRSGNRVMVMEDAEGCRHVLPGGRIEPGESYLGALRREIREETGLALAGTELLGACVFTHTTPRPDNYQYPYPTMIHLIYRAEAAEADPGAMEHQCFEVSCELVEQDELERIILTAGERALVEASYTDPKSTGGSASARRAMNTPHPAGGIVAAGHGKADP